MRAAPAALAPALPIAMALLLAPACSSGCSSSLGRDPVVRQAALRALLVTATDVALPGYTATTPAGEEQASTATAIRYFTLASGFRQLTVTLVATTNKSTARAAATAAVTTALDSLRNPRTSTAGFGSGGRRVAGRTKGYGALQDSVYFAEGTVAVSVTLSSSTPDQPPDLVTGVARAQDAKLRTGA